MKKIAVILANLGGPDSLRAVRPFLFNLFNDPAIITLPNPFRWLLATFISTKRKKTAQEIYKQIGGKSPILDFTLEQAEALEKWLNNNSGCTVKLFTTMRYWKPFARQVVKDVKSYAPDEIIFIPLYPQFSTTTTASSVKEWRKESQKHHLSVPCKVLCCYPVEPSFIAAHSELITTTYQQALASGIPRILFSAHGLPKKMIEKGDPYQWQVEQTVKAITEKLRINKLDYRICYQSRVGRLEWITPSTEEEIENAGKDNVPLVIVPISFVSEHSETLVELDIEYKKLAGQHAVPGYYRVPALATEKLFIESLSNSCNALIQSDYSQKNIITSCSGKKLCPNVFSGCINEGLGVRE
jgi:protoporphyrin/coproporphyrin ferrochelatase